MAPDQDLNRIASLKNVCATTSTLLCILMLVYVSEGPYRPQNRYKHTPKNLQVNIEDEDDNFTQEEPLAPKCEQNVTMAKVSGFNSLSPQIQTFLYYRHCRSFPVILDLPHKCGRAHDPEDIFLLLVIKSPPKNYEHREVLRKTWAKERTHNGKWIRTIFITGTVGSGFEKERMNKLLELEHQRYNDILQWDFNESFFNLTLKQILFLEWMDRRCRHVRFLMNGDDDVFAHTENMVEYLQSLKDNDGSKHLFTGHLIKDAPPIRNPDSKYYIPPQVHEQNPYPAYCGGGGYLLSGHTASVIYNMSKSIEIYPIDDVYMGMCLASAHLEPGSHMGVKTLVWYIPSAKLDKHDPCYMKELLLVHKFSPANLYIMWHEVHNPKLQCGLSTLSKTKQGIAQNAHE
ncbi:N-acetyllactosaminide beta-1,3-N-acetylglucosaminyltransferase 3-like [Nematolebias whitei]|uniref:N-acetyllactosaminide beta-1,3-N-acetylglucosaminyltransferase 3-like n=1 Tax=Nematolebias whitei TaxID=451745 RepID=UPI0018982DAB|nr:N-acetyllactosaminide beta-1,3-N-acetylglucosaminyltransferase 3-like [Nematolebias whitei]